MSTTRVLIVDDHPLLRRGVKQLLELEPEFTCIGEANSGQEALQLAEAEQPDLILLDLNMNGMDGLETLRALRGKAVESRIIILTVSDSDTDVVQAMRDGADGYLLKDTEPEELVSQLRQANDGRLVVSESLTPALARALGRPSKNEKASLANLTAREREILKLIARGKSNKMIAKQLDIAEGTIKVHVRSILKKLGLRSRVEAAIWAVNQGIR
ncbi:MAG: two-component system response regulator NarL [Ectothiorhodospiraceae bacterium]|nr:two-component system response regulator NarL [Ectothiorhodospiraceae bacterium]MCH8503953.1 two-component system response regulator NarL [Ectothiorhodospiraceae bacterium]